MLSATVQNEASYLSPVKTLNKNGDQNSVNNGIKDYILKE